MRNSFLQIDIKCDFKLNQFKSLVKIPFAFNKELIIQSILYIIQVQISKAFICLIFTKTNFANLPQS